MNNSLLYICIILLCMLCSCTQEKYCYEDCSRENYTIPHLSQSDSVNNIPQNEYDIKEVIPLSLPDSTLSVGKSVVLCNDRIYINESHNHGVFVFDCKGNFLHRTGQIGHAKNEIISSIQNYDVDRKTNYVHLYNRDGRKILIYDDKGNFQKVTRLHDYLPSKIVISEKGYYISSCNISSTKEKHTKLVMLDSVGNNIKTLFESDEENNITCEGMNTDPLFSDHEGNISYLSLLADSVIVLSADSVNQILNFSFNDGFLPDNLKKEAKHVGDLFVDDAKINFISKVYVNEYFVFIEYFGKNGNDSYQHNYSYLYDKSNNKSYSQNGSFGFSKMFGSVNTIFDDFLVCLITEEDIEHYLALLEYINSQRKEHKSVDNNVESVKAMYNEICQDIIAGKIKTPVLIKIKLK